MPPSTSDTVVRIAAIGDIHYSRTSQGSFAGCSARLPNRADVLVIAGDLTDYGLAEEARILAKDLGAAVKVPVVGVLGNHDFESGEERDISRILADVGVHMLDGDTWEHRGRRVRRRAPASAADSAAARSAPGEKKSSRSS